MLHPSTQPLFALLLIITISNALSSDDFCGKVGRNFEIENNVSVTSSSHGVTKNVFIVSIQNGAGKYGKMSDRCVITINEPCEAFFECAGNKAKLINSIYTANINSKYGVLMIDGDSAVRKGSFLKKISKSKRILSLRPDSKRWSTAGMYWPINSLKYEKISILLEKLKRSGRDDVAFQSIKEGRLKSLDERYIYHARGNDILGKNAVLKIQISSITTGISILLSILLMWNSAKRNGKSKSKAVLEIVCLIILVQLSDNLLTWIIVSITKGYSRYPIANDSRFSWYNSIRVPISICWQFSTPIVRHDLYGAFLEVSIRQSIILLLYLFAKDFGLSIIIIACLINSQKTSFTMKKFQNVLHILLRISFEIIFSFAAIAVCVIFVSCSSNVWHWHDSQGYYSIISTCRKNSCSVTGPYNFIRSFFSQAKWFVVPFALISMYVCYYCSKNFRKNRIVSFLIIGLLTSDNLIRTKPNLPDITTKTCDSVLVNIGPKNEFAYNVTLPCDLSLLERERFIISPNSINVVPLTQPELDHGWKKVALLKSLCKHRQAPNSMLVYDNYVPELDGIANSLFGGKSRKHADLITDPYDSKYVAANIGKFNLKRCSLIKAWARKANYTSSDGERFIKLALNDAIAENDGIHVRRHKINYKHTKEKMESLAFSAVKKSISFVDIIIWGVFLRIRSKKKIISTADIWIFGVIGVILAPKFTIQRDVIYRHSELITATPVISQWTGNGNQIIWTAGGVPIKLTDYSPVAHVLIHDFFTIFIYAFASILLAEIFMVLKGSKSLIDYKSILIQTRNAL